MTKDDPPGATATADDAKTASTTTKGKTVTIGSTDLTAEAAAQTAEADKQLDDLIDQSGAKEPPQLPRNEKGQFAKTAKNDDTTADDQPVEGGDTEDATDDQQAVDTDSEDYQTAKVALTRFRAPQSQLDLLAKGDTGVLAHGLHLAKIQKDGDEYRDSHKETANKLAETEKQLTELQKVKADDKARGTEANKSQEQSLDINALVEPLAKHFEETFGEDVAEPVRQSFAGLAEQLISAASERDQALRDEIKSLQKDLTRRDKQFEDFASKQTDIRNTQTRKDLLKEWPQLKDDGNWDRVQARLKTIPTGDEWPSDDKARMELALLGEFRAELTAEAKSARTKTRDLKNNGTPQGSTRTATPPTVMTGEELQDAALTARMSGDNDEADKLEEQIRQLRP